MKRADFRCTVRRLMVLVGLISVLLAGGMQGLRWLKLRAGYLQQVSFAEEMLQEAKQMLSGGADWQEDLARLPAAEHAASEAQLTALLDQARRKRDHLAVASRRWLRLADHPWEPIPTDLYRMD